MPEALAYALTILVYSTWILIPVLAIRLMDWNPNNKFRIAQENRMAAEANLEAERLRLERERLRLKVN